MGGLGVEGGTNLFLSLYSSFCVLSISLVRKRTKPKALIAQVQIKNCPCNMDFFAIHPAYNIYFVILARPGIDFWKLSQPKLRPFLIDLTVYRETSRERLYCKTYFAHFGLKRYICMLYNIKVRNSKEVENNGMTSVDCFRHFFIRN